MKPTTIKVDGEDVEVMPFDDDNGREWLARAAATDRLTVVYSPKTGPGSDRSDYENFWGVDDNWGVDDLKYEIVRDYVSAALDHFWPGWRERNPKHAGGSTP